MTRSLAVLPRRSLEHRAATPSAFKSPCPSTRFACCTIRLQLGEHTFQVGGPFTPQVSPEVLVIVQLRPNVEEIELSS